MHGSISHLTSVRSGHTLGLILALGLWLTPSMSMAEESVEFALLKTPLALQFGTSVDLSNEGSERLKTYLRENQEALSCGREVCVEWEVDGSTLMLGLAGIEELSRRNPLSLAMQGRAVWFLGALDIALHDAREKTGRDEVFVAERSALKLDIERMGKGLLARIPVHPQTLRILYKSAKHRDEKGAGEGLKRYLKRERDDPLGVPETESLQAALRASEEALDALAAGDIDGLLDATEKVHERLPRTCESDYLRAFESLLQRKPLRALESLRRLEKRTESPLSLGLEAHRVGVLLGRQSRNVALEKHHLEALIKGWAGGNQPACEESDVISARVKLPCAVNMSREDAVTRLQELQPVPLGPPSSNEDPGPIPPINGPDIEEEK